MFGASDNKGDQKGAVTTESLQKERYERQRVVVNIWTSAGNPNHRGHNVGHVSIQTPNQYMSLWPRQARGDEPAAKGNEGLGFFKGISHELLPDYKKDEEYEGRPPEVRLCFYSLNTTDMEREFDRVKDTLKGWSLLGLEKKSESCASLAWHLLQAGGIGKLAGLPTQSSVSSTGSSTGSFLSGKYASGSSAQGSSSASDSKGASTESQGASTYASEMAISLVVKSPDALAGALTQAKKQELSSHPLTQGLTFAGETVVQTSGPRCVIL